MSTNNSTFIWIGTILITNKTLRHLIYIDRKQRKAENLTFERSYILHCCLMNEITMNQSPKCAFSIHRLLINDYLNTYLICVFDVQNHQVFRSTSLILFLFACCYCCYFHHQLADSEISPSQEGWEGGGGDGRGEEEEGEGEDRGTAGGKGGRRGGTWRSRRRFLGSTEKVSEPVTASIRSYSDFSISAIPFYPLSLPAEV